jgi:hypothetical protein
MAKKEPLSSATKMAKTITIMLNNPIQHKVQKSFPVLFSALLLFPSPHIAGVPVLEQQEVPLRRVLALVLRYRRVG